MQYKTTITRVLMLSRSLTALMALGLESCRADGQEVNEAFAAESARDDSLALASIFSEQHIVDSGHSICERASQQPPNDRFDFLRQWVIRHSSSKWFRITVDFTAGAAESSDAVHLVSPAYDLVRLAGEQNQIDHLRSIITACSPVAQTDQIDRFTLLALIAIETADETSLDDTLSQWYKSMQSDPSLLNYSSTGLILTAQAAVDHSYPSSQISEMVRSAVLAHQAEYDRAARIRHLVALSARLETLTSPDSTEEQPATERSVPQWHLANLERSFEHGNAFPEPILKLERGSYRNLSNYGDMLLLYQSPLMGDFSVEATATGFGYREAHLAVAGRWTGLLYDHSHIILGDLRGELVRQAIATPLNSTSKYGFIRTRVNVHDQQATTWMNGRLVHQQPVPQTESPWVGVRTNYRVRGGVDDLQITGEPIIPERLSLVESNELGGWYDYFQSASHAPSRISGWDVIIDRGEGVAVHAEIIHPRLIDLPQGSHTEQLLRYLRPIAEDGTIAFEFYYEPGQTIAHPAIGRIVYLLTDSGIKRHQLTDGRFDRTDLRPDNAAPMNGESSRPLQLIINQWNRIEIIRRGDMFSLVLNGTPICEEQNAVGNSAPQFGIFHFADQTALRVRDVTWSGQWPKALPKIVDQQLANPLDEIIAWSADKQLQTYQHVFDETSLTSGAFVSVQGNPVETVQATDAGLVVRQTSNDGYRGATISPVIDVGGDFDVTVSFDQAQLRSAIDMIASVQFDVNAINDEQDLAGIQAVRDRTGNRNVQCARILTIDGNARRSYFSPEPAEGDSGQLKLCRRGNKIYYLAADNDSSRFRLVSEETFPTTDLQQRGIRLGVQAQGPESLASVRFTQLTIRAERLGGEVLQDRRQLLTELNQQRDALPIGFSHDFAKQPASSKDFVSWNSDQSWQATNRGLEVVAVGTDNWSSSGLSIIREFDGDFDIALQFSPTQFPTPKKGQQTQVYLQLELTDPERTQVSAILTKNENATVYCQMQVRNQFEGTYAYKTIGNQSVENANCLRLLRRGREFVAIASSQAAGSEAVLGSTELSNAPVGQRGVRMLLHTGGAGLTSKMMLESIQIHAATTVVPNSLSGVSPAAPLPMRKSDQPSTQSQSLPSRVLNSLRSLFN